MNAFKKMRLLSGKTAKQAAEEGNLKYTSILRWEGGVSRPKADVLPTLAKLYGCEIKEFIGEYETAR